MSECRLTLLMREDAQGRDERWCDEHQNWSSDTSLPCYKARAETAEAERDAQRAADLEAEISLRGRVNDLLTQLADRDRRIEKALRECLVAEHPNMLSMTVIGPLMRISAALRGESDE